jgi:hypothetical protein
VWQTVAGTEEASGDTGVAGGIYAYYLAFIDPRGMFSILISVQIILPAPALAPNPTPTAPES